MADPANAVLPFGQFEHLHFARLAVLDDPTLGDIEAHGAPRPRLPVYLAFVGSCDGPAGECIEDLAQRAGTGRPPWGCPGPEGMGWPGLPSSSASFFCLARLASQPRMMKIMRGASSPQPAWVGGAEAR